MASLRGFAKCIGLAPDFSVVHHFFGLRSIPAGRVLFLREQMDRLTKSHFHINVILVGQFTTSQLDNVNMSVFKTRQVYSKVGVGVGRVKWFEIPVGEAEGHEDISSDEEAELLTNSWTVHNNGLDVFVVRDSWLEDGETHAGVSDQGASCDKDTDKSFSGSVVSLNNLTTMAHEIGHDLGLEHNVDIEDADEATQEQQKNLMFPLPSVGELNQAQVFIILQHCLMQPGC